MFGASNEVNAEVAKIIPIFLVSVPFVAIVRVTTASFYASEKSVFSYVLIFIEPMLMLTLMLILPPLFGGQIMIWWSTVIARILSAVLALILKNHVDRHNLSDITLRGRKMNESICSRWLLCPICKSKTRIKLRDDTVLENFLLFCPKCKRETLIHVNQLNISVIKEPDAQTQSR